MSPSATDTGTTYRPAFLPIFGLIFVIGLLTGAALRWFLSQSNELTPGVVSYTYLQLVALVYLWAMAATALIVWMLSIRITPTAIRGRTFWGNSRTLAWPEVRKVTPAGPPGFRFAKIHPAETAAPLWMPLFVKRRDHLREQIDAVTANDHPLRAIWHRP